MKKIYTDQIITAQNLANHSEKLNYLTAILRSLLQTVVISIFEITKDSTPSDETDLVDLIERFLKPVDGLPIQIIDSLLPALRTYKDSNFLHGWFEPTKSIKTPLSTSLIEWVEFRNKRSGHGVISLPIAAEWSVKTQSLIDSCIDVFSQVIPNKSSDGTLSIGKIQLSINLVQKECAIVILGITQKKSIWKLKGQHLSVSEAEEFTIELSQENILSTEGLRKKSDYKLTDITSNNKTTSVFHNIPIRQTDTFEGRAKEIEALKNWIEDEDSRFCLVYGDGGYGKTTLVLEVLNQIIESLLEIDQGIPTIISYQTAKMTRWTENGLVHLTSVAPVMDECIRELVRYFIPTLTPDWYKVSGIKLVDKCVSILKEEGLTRNDVLLIMDNTETLATSADEVKELGEFFLYVGKRIGRIIITSRRREYLEVRPIPVGGLSELEAINLMRNLAKEYHADPIQKAGESTLRKAANKLMLKPLLLEVLVKFISHSKNLGIDAAMDTVYKRTNEELLQFLYEDAWLRMSEFQKEVFFVLIHITSPIDQNSISKTCQEVGIQQTEFLAGLEETHFAVTTDQGNNYSIELVELAKRFFSQKFRTIESTKKATFEAYADRVDKHVTQLQTIEREYKRDRVAEAFRSEYAKAAKIYADKGEVKKAIEMYELAIIDDPLNSALHDRFSFLLLNKADNPEYAKLISQKAVLLDDSNCDALVGYALVFYKLGDINDGDVYIDKAEKIGRPTSFCLLRKAIARYYKAIRETDLEVQIRLLMEGEKLLKEAEQINKNRDGYDAKNQKDIFSYQRKIYSLLPIIRTKITRGIA